jgi:hypothetical protein
VSHLGNAMRVAAPLAILVCCSFLYDALKPKESQLDVDCGGRVGVMSLTNERSPAAAVVLLSSGCCIDGFAEMCPDEFWKEVFCLVVWMRDASGGTPSLVPGNIRRLLQCADDVCNGRSVELSVEFVRFATGLS